MTSSCVLWSEASETGGRCGVDLREKLSVYPNTAAESPVPPVYRFSYDFGGVVL